MSRDEPLYHCLSCLDGGWRPFWCPGSGAFRNLERPDYAEGSIVDCGRVKRHLPHAYAARCECIDTNPIIAARARRRLEQARAKGAA